MSGNICGYVVREGRAVTDAAVTVIAGPGGHIDLAPVTDEDGWFALDGLPAGRWRLGALSPDGNVGAAEVDVWDDSLSDVTIELIDDRPQIERWYRQDIDITIEW